MIKAVIFDLDGTLLDTRAGIVESAKYAAEQLGFPELPYETWLTFVGPPIQQSFTEHFSCDEEIAQKAANLFRDYYKTRALLKAAPYDGIYALCEKLKTNGIKMAIATYKREDYAMLLLRHFGFDRYCDPIHGADNNNILRKEDIVHMCIEDMGAQKKESVLIGDTKHDALGALKAGIPFLAVLYGFGFRKEEDVLEYPHIGIAKTPSEVFDIIVEGAK